ncbi:MAG: hypothetical protein AB7V01_00620 [Vicinamibacterales bacterium]
MRGQALRHAVMHLAAATLLVCAQGAAAQQPIGPGPATAQPVRMAPIQLGRIDSAPILDTEGAFMPLRGSSRGMNIYGIVQNQLGVMVPNAGTVVIRDILTGRVVAQTQVNNLAQFTFQGLEPGLYTAELVNNVGGAVIASSPAFSAAAGEVIQIAQTIPTVPLTGLARFASSATSSAVTSAASSGVLAVTPGAPVSPQK